MVKREYRARLATVCLLFLVLLVAVGAVALVPHALLLERQLAAYDGQWKSATAKLTKHQTLTSKLTQANARASTLVTLGQLPPLSQYLAQIEELRGSSVVVKHVAIERDAYGKVARVTLRGSAVSNAALTDFVDALRASEALTMVDVPSTIVSAGDEIAFTITLTIATYPYI